MQFPGRCWLGSSHLFRKARFYRLGGHVHPERDASAFTTVEIVAEAKPCVVTIKVWNVDDPDKITA